MEKSNKNKTNKKKEEKKKEKKKRMVLHDKYKQVLPSAALRQEGLSAIGNSAI